MTTTRKRLGPALLLSPLPVPGRVQGVMAGPEGGRLVDVEVRPSWDEWVAEATRVAVAIRVCVVDPALAVVRSHGETEGSIVVIADAILGVSFNDFLRRLATAGVRTPLGLALAVTSSMARLVEKVLDFGAINSSSHIDYLFDEWFVCFDGVVRSPLPLTTFWERQTAISPGVIRSTLWALSPEQVMGRATDLKSDVWALGAVLSRLLAGSSPFVGDSGIDQLRAIMEAQRSSLLTTRPDLHPGVDAFVARCLAAKPGDRPDFAALHQGLRLLADSAGEESWSHERIATFVREFFADEARAADLAVEEAGLTNVDDESVIALPFQHVDISGPLERWRRQGERPNPDWEVTVPNAEVEAWGRDGRALVHVVSAAGHAFFIDRAVVTAGEYRRFLDESDHPVGAFNRDAATGSGALVPAVLVGADDAAAYARWAGKRLPTVNESIGAARLRPRLFTAGVWEWTSTASRLGWFVIAGAYRDRPNEAAHPENQAFEDAAAKDVGFRCAADLDAAGLVRSVRAS